MENPERIAAVQNIDQLKQLRIDGQNIIGGGVNAPDALRHRYLQWHDSVERLVAHVSTDSAEVVNLHTPRHRSLVAGAVTVDQMYREVSAEVNFVIRAIDDASQRLLTPEPSAMQEREFIGDSGTTYRYDTMSSLGEGGYGKVFSGYDSSGNPIAVKVVHLSSRTGDRRLAQRELEISRQLKKQPNDHLVHLLDAADTDDALLLVMPKAESSLAERIGAGPIPDDEVRDILVQLARGMVSLSKVGVIHRDIKPRNVLLIAGQWCLSDFGISRNTLQSTATYTWHGTGTLEYRAPELWRGDSETVATDLYALGCVAFEMITGSPPFPGPDFREQHFMKAPVLPYSCDSGLVSIVLSLLAKDAAGRPEDPRQLQEQLQVKGLSAGQHALRDLLARMDRKDFEIESQNAATREHFERQRQAKVRLMAFWQILVGKFVDLVPGATAENDSDQCLLVFRGNRVTLEIKTTNSPSPGRSVAHDLLLFGTLTAIPRSSQRTVLEICNVQLVWQDSQPRMQLVRFIVDERAVPENDSARTAAPKGVEWSLFHDMWMARGGNFSSNDLAIVEEANEDAVISMITAALNPFFETKAPPENADHDAER
ncbi:serine/threonine protein kinase [Allocatelliglobosispora scoriae]|uniref:mitogen-activated protein kinase kinase n=1 Tax=Allocatelliglobosispora scoriae TaxID=643052 RepID=A0A841BQK8_9ACTN|nr:serine/threonine-protein kinase [Allocatelliglobosispora scoriae]MBB5869668.1 serine/threonine protein kinase [Allocatelliglobosispora scoriae]